MSAHQENISPEFVRGSLKQFTSKSDGKEFNDRDNKIREEVLNCILGDNLETKRLFIEDPSCGDKWSVIETNIRKSLEALRSRLSDEKELEFSHLRHKGGRNNKFDFTAVFINGRTTKEFSLKTEFKFGKSIYDQPEFLQIYAQDKKLINASTTSYADFFYERYSHMMVPYSGHSKPSREKYMKEVFKNKSSEPFFLSLYNFSKSGKENNNKLKQIASQSIDDYLHNFKNGKFGLDFISIKPLLKEQVGKFFLSWDYHSLSSRIEEFTLEDMTIENQFSLKEGRTGKLNTIIFTAKSGRRIEALLRWKNHPGVLGPAWQLKLKRNPTNATEN